MNRPREDYSIKMSLTQPLASSEARGLFQKLWSWKEESNRQFTNIMKSHCNNIDNGIKALVEEVYGLKAELSDVRQEKNVLLETVDDFEFRQCACTWCGLGEERN